MANMKTLVVANGYFFINRQQMTTTISSKERCLFHSTFDQAQ